MKNNKENFEHCKEIALRLEAVAEGLIYRCPECGEWIEWDNDQYDGDNATYTCQECNATFDENEFETVSFYDYFEDGIFDTEFRIGTCREYRSVKIMIACGGPNIFIDTAAGAVQLYWWTDRAEFPLNRETVNALDEWAEEWFNC